MRALEKLPQVKEMFIQLAVYYYKMIAIDLSKQQAFDADPRAIQQITFTTNLDRTGNTRIYFILEKAKETILDFSQGTVKVLLTYYRIYCKIIF